MKVKHITEISGALMRARWKQTLVAAVGVTFSIAFLFLYWVYGGFKSTIRRDSLE